MTLVGDPKVIFLDEPTTGLDHGRLVAEGTSEELKARIPGGYIELKFADHGDLDATSRILQAMARDGEALTLQLPATLPSPVCARCCTSSTTRPSTSRPCRSTPPTSTTSSSPSPGDPPWNPHRRPRNDRLHPYRHRGPGRLGGDPADELMST